MLRVTLLPLSVVTALALAAPATIAQVPTIEYFGGANTQAIDLSPDGMWVVGVQSTSGFRWSSGSGLELFPLSEAWGISADGAVMAGAADNGASSLEAATHELSAWALHGNLGSPGCGPPFLSNLYGLSDDGDSGAGMSWQTCKTAALKWTASGGLTLLPKEAAGHDARANGISGDGQVIGGWETADNGSRRASVWWDDVTQEFILAGTPGNAPGYGEVTHVNTDGSVICGAASAQAFVWTTSGGVQLLPNPPGLGGSIIANGVSDDGTVAAGVSAQFPLLNAWIWTSSGGSVKLRDYLIGLGLTVPANDLRNATSVSADGTRICGWGASGSWVITLDTPVDPWADLGQGLAGVNGVPTLGGDGPLTAGSLTTVELSNGVPNGTTNLVLGVSILGAPFKGGVLVPNPDIILAGLPLNAQGDFAFSFTWPAGLPSGASTWWQHWIPDVAGPLGWSASNGLQATTP